MSGKLQENYNPRLKALIMQILDNQLRDNNPPTVKETLTRLIKLGYSQKQAREKIAAVIVVEVYDIIKDMRPFNAESYSEALNELK